MLALAALQTAPPPAPTAEPKVATLAKAFSACIRTRMAEVPATLTAEAGADHLLEACKAERLAVSHEVDVMTASAPPEAKAGARAEYEAAMAQARAAIIENLAKSRAAKPR